MNLEQFQRTFFELMRQPLTASGGQRARTVDGRSIKTLADQLITPSRGLAPFKRLELYSQGYWFRILDALRTDFAGLHALLGRQKFDCIAKAYLADCPPDSFNLRRLGARLEPWLSQHAAHRRSRVAIDMARLEWAEIEALESAQLPALTAEDLRGVGDDPIIHLQSHLRLLRADHPVELMLSRIRECERAGAMNAKHTLRVRARLTRISKPQHAILAVYRIGDAVHHKRLDQDAFVLLSALQQSNRLSHALHTTIVCSGDDVQQFSSRLQQWFAEWSSLGWFAHRPADGFR